MRGFNNRGDSMSQSTHDFSSKTGDAEYLRQPRTGDSRGRRISINPGFPFVGTIGYEFAFPAFESNKHSNYPPYNLYKTSDTTYIIELAVAGFAEDQLNVEVDKGTLFVTGRITGASADPVSYIHRGIGLRDFSLNFKIAETVVVKEAGMKNGLLEIVLEQLIPEDQKKTNIPIKSKERTILKG